MTKNKSELLEKDAVILKMRGEASKMQVELSSMLNTTNDEKEKMRSEYLTVIDRQKKEVAALNERMLQNNRQGQSLDANVKALSEENDRLRESLVQSE